jgi:hypothetical protein
MIFLIQKMVMVTKVYIVVVTKFFFMMWLRRLTISPSWKKHLHLSPWRCLYKVQGIWWKKEVDMDNYKGVHICDALTIVISCL